MHFFIRNLSEIDKSFVKRFLFRISSYFFYVLFIFFVHDKCQAKRARLYRNDGDITHCMVYNLYTAQTYSCAKWQYY